jgi:hypothetical protein
MIEISPHDVRPQAELRPVRGAVSITGGTVRLAKPLADVPLGVPDKTAIPAGMLGSRNWADAPMGESAAASAILKVIAVRIDILAIVSSPGVHV